MSSSSQYWVGSIAVVDWPLTTIDGTPVDDATVTGTVTLPDGSTAGMTITNPATGSGDPYRASYQATTAGLHAYRLTASGTVVDATEGTFVVQASLVGAAPITVDPTTAIGQVRLLVPDLDPVAPLFTDAQITAFLTIAGNRIRLATAEALGALASNEAMVSKVIRTLDLQVDGTKVAAELRARAGELREQDAEYDTDGNLFAMDIVDFRPDRFLLPDAEQAEISWCP